MLKDRTIALVFEISLKNAGILSKMSKSNRTMRSVFTSKIKTSNS